MSRNPYDRGITLIELVVVLAVFALIATMSLQALSGTLRQRDRLLALEAETADITLALTLLRADLQAAAPLVFHPPNAPAQSALTVLAGGRGMALSVSGRFDVTRVGGAGLGRVIWRLQDGNLTRQSWPTLIPATSAQQSPVVVMARGITGFELRRLTPDLHWQTGPDVNAGAGSSHLPRAINVILDSATLGRISTLVGYP